MISYEPTIDTMRSKLSQCIPTKTSMEVHTHYRLEIEVAAMFVRRKPIQKYQRFYIAKKYNRPTYTYYFDISDIIVMIA